MSDKVDRDVSDDAQGAGLVPRLRFPEFSGRQEWELKPLGRLGQFVRGLTYSAEDVSEDGLLVLRAGNIQAGRLKFDIDLVHVSKRCSHELLLRDGDVAICMSSGSKALVGKSGEYRGEYEGDVTVGAFCSIFRTLAPFAKLAFSSRPYELLVAREMAGGSINNLSNVTLEAFEWAIPAIQAEQVRIVDCLSSLDELIVAETRKLDALKTLKKGLMQQLLPREGETVPRLRFPEFVGEWECAEVGELISTIAPPKKLATGAYLHEGSFPILDQGQETVAGWTNDETALVAEEGPLIVFGDHTCKVVLARQPFAQGADGIKILRTRDRVSTEFLYQTLLHRPIASIQYKRHFSILRERRVCFPSAVAEQQRIADFLSCLDGLIAAEARRLDALRAHKKGLMQQLFPQEAAGA